MKRNQDNDEYYPKIKAYRSCKDRTRGADDCPNCFPSNFREGEYVGEEEGNTEMLLDALKVIAAQNCSSKTSIARMIADIRAIAREAIDQYNLRMGR